MEGAAPQQLFAVVVPGRPMQTLWHGLSDTRAVLFDAIFNARDIPDVCLSFIPGEGSSFMVADRAAVFYWAPMDTNSGNAENWSLLGALHAQAPSGLFRTGWGAALATLPATAVRLAVSLEPMAVATNLGLGAGGEAIEDRRNFAAAIARDLWNFLGSFSQTTPYAQQQASAIQSDGSFMMVPTDILDRWMERFNHKFNRDPNFMLKPKD